MALNKKIVLVNPDIERLEERFGTITLTKLKAQPPLGLCSIAATLEAAGHSVIIEDGYAESLGPDKLAQKIQNHTPDLVGFSVTCLNVSQAEATANILKNQSDRLKIVFGGPQITLQPNTALVCPAVDYALLGEGDVSFPRMVSALAQHEEPRSVAGLIWRETAGAISITAHPEPVKNLDRLPFPARHLLDWSKYNLSGDYLIPAKRVLTISSSRGCPYRCTFCSSSVYWNCSYRARSAVSVVDEIELMIRDYGADGLNFREDNFMVNRKRVQAICREILARGIRIPWVCEARVDNIDRNTLELMRKAGLVGVWCGVESGSPRILKQIRKGYTVEQVRSAFSLFNDLGINTRAGFMIGFPDETEEDIEQTYSLAEEISPSHAYFQSYVAFPRGELYDKVVNEGLYCDKWRDVYRVKPRNIPAESYTQLEATLRQRFEGYKLKRNKENSHLPDLGTRVLVICTSGIAIVQSALEQIRRENPDCCLETFSKSTLDELIKPLGSINRRHVYHTDWLNLSTLPEELLRRLKNHRYDSIVITFSNGSGQGYENVIEVARLLRYEKLLGYNRLGSVMQLDTGSQTISNHKANQSVCELNA